MEQRLSLVTLAVRDLARATAFYRDGLGWTPGFQNDEVTFFQLNGVVFSLFRLDRFAAELGVGEDVFAPGGCALAYNVRERGEVDEVMALAVRAGGVVAVPPCEAEWGGYSGYFLDLDGHRWEVAWNPGWPIAADGAVRLVP